MKKLFILIASAALLMLTACTNTAKEQTPPEAETKTIVDARGEVEIPVNPQRIVDLSGNSDILHILGYKVIGTANSDAYDYTKFPSYLEDILQGAAILGYSMQDTMDIEGVINLEPDLIVISNVQEKMYEQLQAIAPTVMIQLEALDWKEDIKRVGSVMGKEAEAQAWLDSYAAQAEKAGKQIKETYGEDVTYLSFLASGGQFYVFSGAGFGGVLYNDLELGYPAGMPPQDSISLPVVTYEGLAAIQADYIFAIATEADLAEMNKNSIWKGLEAVKNNHVVVLPSSPYFNQGYSPIGKQLLLDETLALLNGIQ